MLVCTSKRYPKREKNLGINNGRAKKILLVCDLSSLINQCLASSRIIRHYEISDNRDGPTLTCLYSRKSCQKLVIVTVLGITEIYLAFLPSSLAASAKKDVDPPTFVEIDSGKISFPLRCSSLSLFLSFFLCKSQSPRFDEED